MNKGVTYSWLVTRRKRLGAPSIGSRPAKSLLKPNCPRCAMPVWLRTSNFGAPKFDVRNQTGIAQRGQFGFNNDFAGLLPIDGAPNRFLLVTNHEYVTPLFMFP